MISFIESWWDTLNFSLQVFYGIAIVALIFLVFQMITTFVFGMDDASGGVDISHHDSGMSIFSVRGITLDYSNAVGQIATVYLTISPVQRPGGQVEVMIQGRLVTAEALQKGSQPLSPGTKVKIVDKIGLTALLVEPLD